MSKFIFLAGNISEGYRAYGPMDTFDEVCEVFDGMEGWVMELKNPNTVRPTKIVEMKSPTFSPGKYE